MKSNVYSIVIACLMILVYPLQHAAAEGGLVLHCTFDGNAEDHSGMGNHGIASDVAWASDGINGLACDFGMATSSVMIPDSESLNTDDAFTLCAWVKPQSFPATASPIISKWFSGPHVGDYILSLTPEGQVRFTVANGEGGGYMDDRLVTARTLPINEWTFVSATFSHGLMSIYIDGVLEESRLSPIVTHTHREEYEHDEIHIGSFWHLYQHLDGAIDEVRIHNRALSAAEIAELYEEHAELSTLVLHYTFDEDAGANVVDVSGNGNHGVTEGAEWELDALHGGVYAFDGEGARIAVSNEPAFDFDVMDSFSVSAWVEPMGTEFGGIFEKSKAWHDYGISMTVTDDQVLRASVFDGFGLNTEGTTILTGAWHHVCMVHDGSTRELAVWVDGAREGTVSTLGHSHWLNDEPVYIGGRTDPDHAYEGRINEVMVFQCALHSNEIVELSKAFPDEDCDLVLHYTFDNDDGETVIDVSDSENHGTLFGDPEYRAGFIGQSLRCDGVDDMVVVDGTGPEVASNFTLCAWVRLPRLFGFGTDAILCKSDQREDSARGIEFYINSRCGILVARLWNDEGQFSSGWCYTRARDRRWHHYVLQHDASLPEHQMRMYVDGRERPVHFDCETASSIPAVRQVGEPWRVGYLPSNQATHLRGLIDEVKIYDRTLTPAEVAGMYAAQLGSARAGAYSNIRAQAWVGGPAVLFWTGCEGMSYDLWWSTNLLEGFEILQTNLLCEGELNSFETDFSIPDRCFFRLNLAE